MSEGSPQPDKPRAVLPYASVEMQTQQDGRVGQWAMYGLLIVIIVGLFALMHGGLPAGMNAIAFFAVILAVGIAVFLSIPRSHLADDDSWIESPDARRSQVTGLDYESLTSDTRSFGALGVIGALILGGVFGIAGMVALGLATRRAEIAIGGPLLVGVTLLFVRGARPIGIGILLSPALAYMIIFAICAGFK